MTRILIIEDDHIYQKMVEHALQSTDYELSFADDGVQGLAQATVLIPDLIICDVMMPGMDGYEVIRRLRRDARFARLPVLLLTAQTDLDEKLAGFEAGADDYMTKPFAPPELLARVSNLIKKEAVGKPTEALQHTGDGHVIAVHNLRGGLGCSTIAVNLAAALHGLWDRPTIILDLVLTAGQVALMLNGSLRRTWADLGNRLPGEIDVFSLHSIINHHDSGLDFIAAPTFPPEADLLTPQHFTASMNLLRGHYEYIVVDLPHDFREISYNTLDIASEIILITSPEMASVRAAAAAMETYKRLGYDMDKVKLILNWTFEKNGLARKNIETALHHPIRHIIPFVPWITIEAINYGQPFMLTKPAEEISLVVENLAYMVSREEDRAAKPDNPTKAWMRTTRRLRA